MEILIQALLDEPPDIVHFSGHGVEQGIILQDEYGARKVITKEALESLFEEFKDKIKCVILNACYSELQATAIRSVIPIVIGMKAEVDDEAATAFSTGFYQAIGAGKNIPTAFNLGLSTIKGQPGKDIALLL
jgi:L-arabinose isomerase